MLRIGREMDMGQATVIRSHRVDIADRSSACPLDLGTIDFRCNRADDLLGNLVLQIENIIQGAVKPIGPEVGARRDIDELPVDP